MIDKIQRNAKALIAALAPLILAGINIYQQVTESGSVGAARWWLVAALSANALILWAVPNAPVPPVPVPLKARPGYRTPEL